MALIYEIDDQTVGYEETKPENTNPKTADGLFYSALEMRGIEFSSFAYCEVLFRQLMMAKQFNTGIEYTDDKNLKSFCGKMSPQQRTEKIKAHIALSRKKENQYGFNRLTIDKKEDIKKAEIDLKKSIANIQVLKDKAKELTQNETDFFDLEAEMELVHKNLVKQKNKEFSEGVYRGRGFVYINEKSELIVDVKKFHFLKFYAVIYFSLMAPFFNSFNKLRVSGEEPTEHDLKVESQIDGLKGFIARKLNFEFQNRLGFKPTSQFISKLLKYSKTLNHISDEIESMKIVDEDFFESLK